MGEGAEFERASAVEAGMDQRLLDRATEMIHEQVETGRSPGIAAFVMRHGKVVLDVAAGIARPDGTPMTQDSVWSIASATKPLTAALTLQLVEEGRIGLNQAVKDYLPEISDEAADGLLVHHLFTHTGGFEAVMWTGEMQRRLLECAEEDARFGRDRTVNAFLGCLPTLKRRAKPGSGMMYASLSYEMLGEMVRRCLDTSLDDAMCERLTEPLGMHSTALRPTEDMARRQIERADGLPFSKRDAAEYFGTAYDPTTDEMASGGSLSTPSDYVRFLEMIRRGGELGGVRLLSPATVRSMTTNQIPGVPDLMFGAKEANWGFGFSVLGTERWPYFGGGLVPHGAFRHAGAGGIDHWVDPMNGVTGAYFEIITERSDMLEPLSSAGHRFQDVITAACLD